MPATTSENPGLLSSLRPLTSRQELDHARVCYYELGHYAHHCPTRGWVNWVGSGRFRAILDLARLRQDARLDEPAYRAQHNFRYSTH
jgi:hypothetical protein